MPANTKYLTKSIGQRFAKISSGLIGGYLISASTHLALAYWLPDSKIVFSTSVFSIFLLWMVLMILPFFYKNGWKVWAVYSLVILLLFASIYFGKNMN